MTDWFCKILNTVSPPVVLCIGSDRVLGDALGPITGELLKKKFDVPAFVYGSLSLPVNAVNIDKATAFITTRHRNAKIIAIDGSVGPKVGKITISDAPLRPGLASGKDLPCVGDVSITATVASHVNLLSTVRLGVVYDLAFKTAKLVANALLEVARTSQTTDYHQYNTIVY